MANPFDQFDNQANPFNQFDAEQPQQSPKATPASEMQQAGTRARSLVGFAAPMVETYYGAKQLLQGGLDKEEQSNLKAWKEMSAEAPVLSTIGGNVANFYIGGRLLKGGGSLLGNTLPKLSTISKALTNTGQALMAPKTLTQAAGAAGGYMALQPVEGEGVGVGERLLNGVAGAATAAIAMKVADKIGAKLASKYGARETITDADVDDAIAQTLRESGQSVHDMPQQYIGELRAQVKQALQQGKKLDVKSAMRAQEFKQVGIDPTLGQVTRDPMQYATERNLRGVAGVGDPLLERFSTQENALRGKIGQYAAGASDRYQAGGKIGKALTQADEAMSNEVSRLYRLARESAGKDLELPVQGLAQDYANILRDFGDKVPSGVRNNLDDLGLLTGKQNKIFTVEEADRLLKVINSNSSNDPAVNAALSALRNAVKKTVTDIDASGGVYAPAVKAAAQRFKMHDMLPALRQAAKGDLDADKFVARHIVGAKPESVQALAKVLKSVDEEAYKQAKAQIGEYLRRAAYGLNEAGDSGFRHAGFAKALDSLGARLNAFYTPAEIAQMKQLSRVGSYMYAIPAQAAVSTSNSGVPVQNTLMQLLNAKIPFAGTIVNAGKGLTQNARQNVAVKSALGAKPTSSPLNLLPNEADKYQNSLRALMAPVGYTIPYMISQ